METERARLLHIGSIVVALALIVLALFVFTAANQQNLRLGLLVALVVLLAAQFWLYRDAQKAPVLDTYQDSAPPLEGLEEPARIVIKCKQCSEVFPVLDTGSRPLVAACPHCGKSGTIKVKADVA